MGESNLYQKIREDVLAAAKRKDDFALRVLRFVQAALDAEAKDKRSALTDEEVIKVLRRRLKQSQDSQAQFVAGGRADLAEAEEREAALVATYLPQALPEAELTGIVERAVAEAGATTPKDFGRAMSAAMAAVSGRADGSAVKSIVQKILEKK